VKYYQFGIRNNLDVSFCAIATFMTTLPSGRKLPLVAPEWMTLPDIKPILKEI
jgi:hypothetical protein